MIGHRWGCCLVRACSNGSIPVCLPEGWATLPKARFRQETAPLAQSRRRMPWETCWRMFTPPSHSRAWFYRRGLGVFGIERGERNSLLIRHEVEQYYTKRKTRRREDGYARFHWGSASSVRPVRVQPLPQQTPPRLPDRKIHPFPGQRGDGCDREVPARSQTHNQKIMKTHILPPSVPEDVASQSELFKELKGDFTESDRLSVYRATKSGKLKRVAGSSGDHDGEVIVGRCRCMKCRTTTTVSYSISPPQPHPDHARRKHQRCQTF